MSLDDDFFEAFWTRTTGAYIECACGKMHFDYNDQYDEQTNEELDRMLESKKEHPEEYQDHDGSVSAVNISGYLYVPGCSCGEIERFKKLVDVNAISIAAYLRAKSETLKKLAADIDV